MGNFTEQDVAQALRATHDMIGRTERSQEKFAQGSSQHTLQRNRLKALRIAAFLIAKEQGADEPGAPYTVEELKNALAPLRSLMSKSEKAREKLREGSWQHTMLTQNLGALCLALPLLEQALGQAQAKEGS